MLLTAGLVLACAIRLDGAFTTSVYVGKDGPFRFLVDTGTTTTVLDHSMARRIGVEPVRAISALSATGMVEAEEAEVREVRVGTVSVAVAKVLIAELPHLRSRGRLDGILGMSFFAGHSLMFDVRHGCVQIDAAPTPGVSLSAHEVAGRVAVESDGLNLILDSGASFAVLTSPRAAALAMRGGTAEVTSAAGLRRTIEAIVPRLRFGQRVLRDIPAAIALRGDPREDVLLPLALFDRVFIAADRATVLIR